jgi:hypothetical protein
LLVALTFQLLLLPGPYSKAIFVEAFRSWQQSCEAWLGVFAQLA